MFYRTKTKGFTLIELLVAIAIIGVIVSLTLVNMNISRVKARNVKRLSDLNQIQFALEQYYDDFGYYPLCGGVNVEVCESYWGDPTWTQMGLKTSSYLPVMPLDPKNTFTEYGYTYARRYRKTGDSTYVFTNLTSDYILATRLESYTGGPGYTTFPTIPGSLLVSPNTLLGNQ